MPVVGVEPTRVISTRDFEFSGGFSIWCHLVIFKVIWYPTLKRKNNGTSNEFFDKTAIFRYVSPQLRFFDLEGKKGNWRDI